jgi:phosphoglycerol transferase MdoB-like AlkP superfamily enzyme
MSMPAFIHGLRMDLSVLAYCFLPPILLIGVFLIRPFGWIRKVEYSYHLFILFLFCIMLPANIALYHFWNSLLSFRSLSYLKDFSEISSSFTLGQLSLLVISLLLFILTTFYIFRKHFLGSVQAVNDNPIKKVAGWLGLGALAVICMRGGLQKLPMNESLVSVSENNFVNQGAVNPAWHLANDIYRAGIFAGNPFETAEEQIAEEIVKKLFDCEPDSFPQILVTDRPNIVLIILESYTADVVASLGGEKNISPSLENLIGEGVFFNSIYASGTRTDQGIVSLFNGWPATPYYSIMRSTEKSRNLPSLPVLFLEEGYATSFYYGGKSNFSNLNVYCFNQKFERIVDEGIFPDTIPRGGWGIHDEFVFRFQLDELNRSRQPFFSSIMTLSNHEPFDVPGPVRIPGNKEADRFRNSAAYTDAVLGEYIEKAKQQPWYRNTLFIIAADHGHSLPLHKNVYYPDSHRIPFLLFGEVIKPEFRGAVVTKLGGHHDLAGTLLPQLGMPKEAKYFEWSKNLLNPTVESFAYYQIDHLLGWVEGGHWFGYSYNRNKYIARSFTVPPAQLDSMKKEGQAFVQVLYERYLRY